jgi:hypothetical protein
MLLDNAHTKIIRQRQQTFPVETVPLARDLGIPVYSVDGWADDLSGMIKIENEDRNNPQYAIYVNKNHASVRRRFTIAHEIAHFLLHKDLIGDGIVDDGLYRSGLPSKIETQANNLAAEILMPWHLLNEAMKQGFNTVPLLAEAFNVSKSAMSIRLGVPYETQISPTLQPNTQQLVTTNA